MMSRKITLSAIGVATAVVAAAACSTRAIDDRSGTTSSAVRTVTEVPGSPACPEGTMLLCRVRTGNPDGGPPRDSNQCAGLIDVVPMGGGTAVIWFSVSGQLVDAVIVSGEGAANVYAYSPPVLRDADLLLVPQGDGGELVTLSRVDFCGTLGAGVDAGADAAADAPEDAPVDAPSDARGPKAW